MDLIPAYIIEILFTKFTPYNRMKKILCFIASYSNIKEFYKVLDTINSYKNYELDIIIYTTENIEDKYLSDNVKVKMYPKTIGHNLVLEHRSDIIPNLEKYDLFLYLENDILIKEETINTFVRENKYLPDDTSIGFIRYEEYDGKRYLNEFMPNSGHNHLPKYTNLNDRVYFSLDNVHQGCWLLEKRNLQTLLAPDKKQFNLDLGPGLEAGASNFYRAGAWPGLPNSICKVYPIDCIDDLFIHHASNKHTQTNRGFMTDLELKNHISLTKPK